MSEAEFWEWVASEVRKARGAEGFDFRELLSRELERELAEAGRMKKYYFQKGSMEEFYYWEGYFHALLTVKSLLRKLGVVG